MIGRTNCGAGGGGKAVITVYGGANEVITYAGAETGTITLNSSGQGVIEVKKGVYSFTAGLSGMAISKACENGTVVRLRPERFIYWYGVVHGTIQSYDSYGTLTFGDNSFTFKGGYQDWGAAVSDIDCSQDTKVSAKCTTVTSNTYCQMLYSSYKNNTGGVYANLKANETISLAYIYAENKKAMLAVYQSGNNIVVTEWYLGEREAA